MRTYSELENDLQAAQVRCRMAQGELAKREDETAARTALLVDLALTALEEAIAALSAQAALVA